MSYLLALAGNQNCGKTTLFNALTGSNQHVGNFPGVTVEKKEGPIRKYKDAVLVDLPGIYSLSPYTSEEVVTRDFLIKEHPDAIINIVDATNLERNLYLTLQLMELNIPMILALNMMDEVRASGNSIHIKKLSERLGIPVIPISAAKGEGISDLLDVVIKTVHDKKPTQKIGLLPGCCPPRHPLDRAHHRGPRPGCRLPDCALPPPSWWRAMSRCLRRWIWTWATSTSSTTSSSRWRRSWAPTAKRPWPTCATATSRTCAPSAWSSIRKPASSCAPKKSTRC